MTCRALKTGVVFLMAVVVLSAVVGQAQADGSLTNHIGSASFRTSVAAPSLDIEDFISVYRFDTAWMGSFDVALFDHRTPATVENFRGYADRGDYTQTFIHRSVNTAGSGIGIIQGGGFAYSDAGGAWYVPSGDPVVNEPGILNTGGTIALAKTAAGPDSGTNQWYFNTTDNPALDSAANNGGYTAFGEVLYDGMTVVGVDGGVGGIANLPVWNAESWHPAFTNLPLHPDYDGSRYLEERDLVTFRSISQVTGQTYAVFASSDPGLVTGQFTGGSLALTIADDAEGSAELTIRTTDGAGQWFDSVLVVEVVLASADFDGDNDVDADDIDLMLANLTGPGTPAGDAAYDFDGDGDADQDDLVYVVENLVELQDGSARVGTIMGDSDLDGLVNEDDLAAMGAGFGAAGGWANGNLNSDGVVNATDLAILATTFGQSIPDAGDVPEPATACLLAMGGLALLRRRSKIPSGRRHRA